MTATALATTDRTLTTAPSTITADQLALIKSTVAHGATDAELSLFLHDCRRQGVHPLDKLIHFTKRAGKYTPITSIDFMRIRAAATGECIGIDDAVFVGTPKSGDFAATVTVWRFVHGQRSAFTATARWTEYKPDANDFMWQKMPFVMLGKCAEALALRKGFPQQLAGLYAKEELDQAETIPGTVIPEPDDDAPPGAGSSLVTTVTDVRQKSGQGKKGPFTRFTVQTPDGDYSTFDRTLAELAKAAKVASSAVELDYRKGQYGRELLALRDVLPPAAGSTPHSDPEPPL